MLERDDACDIAIVPLDGTAWPARASHADYAWDPAWSPDGTLLAWHEWDLPDMPWDGSRIVVRGPDGATKVVAGGEAIAVGQPRFAPDGARLAYISDAAGWSTIWTADTDGGNAQPVLREPREHAEPAWGPGATLVRVVTRRRTDRVVPQRGRLRPARDRDAGEPLRARALEGLAPRSRLGRARDRVRAFRRGDAVASRGARRERIRPARDRARTGRRLRVDATRRAARDHVQVRQRDRARVCCTGRRGATRPPLVVHLHGGPTGQATADWNARVQWLVQRGLRGAATELPRVDGLRPRVRAVAERAMG